MQEPFIGGIVLFGGNFAPRGWAFCDGQLLSVADNSALFSILGTTYGGDGRSTFALPDLRGRVPIHAGTGSGLTPRNLGQRSGSETNTLNSLQLPSHTHTLNLGQAKGDKARGDNLNLARIVGDEEDPGTAGDLIFTAIAPTGFAQLAPSTIGDTGGNQPINNIQPFLALNYIIALVGLYPPRS